MLTTCLSAYPPLRHTYFTTCLSDKDLVLKTEQDRLNHTSYPMLLQQIIACYAECCTSCGESVCLSHTGIVSK